MLVPLPHAGESRKEARKRKKNHGRRKGITLGKEEGKGSRASHVASPKIGKIPILIPEVFHDFKFFYTKIFQSQNNLHTFN